MVQCVAAADCSGAPVLSRACAVTARAGNRRSWGLSEVLGVLYRVVEKSLRQCSITVTTTPALSRGSLSLGKLRPHQDSEDPLLGSGDGSLCQVKLSVPTEVHKHHLLSLTILLLTHILILSSCLFVGIVQLSARLSCIHFFFFFFF